MHPSLLHRPGQRLSLAELSAARLDGHVVEIGEGYLAADAVESRSARALAVAAVVPARTAASGPTAAWIHGAGDRCPAVHHVTRLAGARPRVLAGAHLVYHERGLAPDEVQLISQVAVTCAVTTLVDLLLLAGRDGDERWPRALVQVDPALLGPAQQRIDALRRHPGIRRARTLLARLREDQEVVTR